MAIVVIILGVVIFLVGIAGQVMVGRRFAQTSAPEDRRVARIVATVAALIIGAWLVIAAIVSLIHAHTT